MATYHKGILGPICGSVGSVIGTSYRGTYVLSSKRRKSRKKPTLLQIAQRTKFAMLVHLLTPLSDFLKLSFRASYKNRYGLNSAFRENYEGVVVGSHPDLSIDYSKMVLSRGNLPNIDRPTVRSSFDKQLFFTWNDNSGTYPAGAMDRVYIAVYSKALDQWTYYLKMALREDRFCVLDIPSFKGKTLEIYIGVLSSDYKRASGTIYLGSIIL